MDRGSPFGQSCSCQCGKRFSTLTAFGNHQNACKKSKKRLSDAVAKVKNVLANRKRKAQSLLTTEEIDQHAFTPVVEGDQGLKVRTYDYRIMTLHERALHRFQKLPTHPQQLLSQSICNQQSVDGSYRLAIV
jgi:hypothetical protein